MILKVLCMVVAAALGVGAIGVITWATAQSGQGPRERAFIVKTCLGVFALLAVFLYLVFRLPHPLRYFVWLPYVIVLPIVLRKTLRRHEEIRKEEADEFERLRKGEETE